jgi:hypothetical protein
MTSAAQGMKSEVSSTLFMFVTMIALFAISTVFVSWLIMNTEGAVISSFILGFSALLWWRDCNRIYNKFDYLAEIYEEDVNQGNETKSHDISIEGYLTTKVFKTKKFLLKNLSNNQSFSWQRRYFVLTSCGELYHFHSKKSYDEIAGDLWSKGRPFDIHQYNLVTRPLNPIQDNQNMASNISNDSNSCETDSLLKHHSNMNNVNLINFDNVQVYELNLECKMIDYEAEKNWSFRFDNYEEFELWRNVIVDVKQFRND